MPMYTHQCPKCKKELETFYSFKMTPEIVCGECEVVMPRVISGNIGGYAKGAGSYATTYNGKHAGNARKSSKK